MHRVGPNPLLGVLDSRSLGKDAHCPLGSLVLRAAVVHAHQPKLGRNIDDAAAALSENTAFVISVAE